MAKWYCGTSDWHTASRVPGPNGHLRRGAPTPDSFRLCSVLQSSAYALGITKRCAVTSSRPTVWRHCSHSNPGRATSSIRPDMIFGKDRWTGADQTTVAVHIVDAVDRAPVFVRARRAGREAALGAAVGPVPAIVGDVVHRVRGVAQRRRVRRSRRVRRRPG